MTRRDWLTAICWGLISVSAVADEMTASIPGASIAETPQTDAAVRIVVARSILFLEKAGVAWMEERGCMSCHHVPFLLWTHRAAQARRFDIDLQKLTAWDDWSRTDSLAHRNLYRLQNYDLDNVDDAKLPMALKQKLKPLTEQPFKSEAEFLTKLIPLLTEDELKSYQATVLKTAERTANSPDRGGGGLDVLGQLLLGSHGSTSELTKPEFRDGTVELMQQLQRSDGSWMPGSQFLTMRRWSVPVANQTTTMWATLALTANDVLGEARSEAVEKAIAYQRQQAPASDNHEWLATRLLFEKQFGSSEEVAKLRQQLLEIRNDDGGWGWEEGAPSDAYTTGLTIYVLAKIEPADDPTIIHDRRKYLVSTQQPDGSWLTPSKNISNTTDAERLKARDEIYHYWGTAWSALGLLESLPVSEASGTEDSSSLSASKKQN